MPSLFSPAQVGPYTLSHRIALAPLTRMRAQAGDVPGSLMAEYYTQRATEGGLLIAEATSVSVRGNGYLGAPGIYADDQIAGWKRVVDAVHAKGARIFLQLYHAGRQSHRDLQPGGAAPLAPSAVGFEGMAHTKDGWQSATPPREMTLEDIEAAIEEFRAGAARALAAGFDGVEIHGANGYLVDQFLQDGSNRRTDAYGGSRENRARFLLDVTAAAAAVFGGERVGVRIAPGGTFGGMSDSDPAATFSHAARELNGFGLAWLHVIEPRVAGNQEVEEGANAIAARDLRAHFDGPIIAAGGFSPETAAAIVEAGDADLVAFGRHFIANPDLPHRIRHGLPLNAYDRGTFYGGDHRGYTDYPRASKTITA
ncbi:alkene reductase [Paraburkholderia lycopersici]|uniref:N-ethylmaleimide reductase n=1 Tax=Paraburkholderia lycopersici TaxID=416944 RepID=A0A1G6HDC3_9BURK|nr:alkene reductase [Paraburkholderia lycopersici]SDB91426.1 N-ethylmaleimide reductase [Paraburkholderia lycopersici]